MLAKLGKRQFQFIPPSYEKDFYYEIFDNYMNSAKWKALVCLDEDLLEHMSVSFLTVLHFNSTGEFLNNAILETHQEWNHLIERYPSEDYKLEYKHFREDVRTLLIEKGFVFEENWLFAKDPDNFTVNITNAPIQGVW